MAADLTDLRIKITRDMLVTTIRSFGPNAEQTLLIRKSDCQPALSALLIPLLIMREFKLKKYEEKILKTTIVQKSREKFPGFYEITDSITTTQIYFTHD